MNPKSTMFSTSGYGRTKPAVPKFNSGETRANQEAAKYASIDFILNQFTKGIQPAVLPIGFADISRVPSNLSDMISALDSTYDIFSQLPSSIRAQMNNDIRNYPAFVQSEAGRTQLIEAGLLKAPVAEHTEATVTKPIVETPAVSDKAKSSDSKS